MNKLKLYRVDVNYIKYLYSFDNKVQYNKEQKDEYTKKRPYLGVVLQVNEFEYFVPLEHPREAHQKMKDNIYILKIHNGKYGILGFILQKQMWIMCEKLNSVLDILYKWV